LLNKNETNVEIEIIESAKIVKNLKTTADPATYIVRKTVGIASALNPMTENVGSIFPLASKWSVLLTPKKWRDDNSD
jgi:hypothetical protein